MSDAPLEVAVHAVRPGATCALLVLGIFDTAGEAERAVQEELRAGPEGEHATRGADGPPPRSRARASPPTSWTRSTPGCRSPTPAWRDPTSGRSWRRARSRTRTRSVPLHGPLPAPCTGPPSASGRDGSVCNLRRRAGAERTATAASSTAPAEASPAARPAAGPEVRKQRQQLEDLLGAPVPAAGQPPVDAAEYAVLRRRYAMLRAFDRKLHRLYGESLRKVQTAEASIACLDEAHPEHRDVYRERYERSLRESGMDPERVALVRFLG